MIKQQNRGKYVCIILFSILELLAIVGAYAAHYFTKTRMGMLRHVIYLNGKWEKALPIATIKWIAVSTMVAIIIIAYLCYRKEKPSSKVNMGTMLFTIALSGWTVYFLLAYNTERNRAYYILSICFILATVLQNIIYHCISSIKSRK